MGNIQQAIKKRTSTKTLAHAPPRAPQTYNVHEDSVWALQASEDWSLVYSGGRDKCVYRTHLHTRTAELLAHEQHPVRKMALDQQVGTGWWALALLGDCQGEGPKGRLLTGFRTQNSEGKGDCSWP